jgi:hypothetical protein
VEAGARVTVAMFLMGLAMMALLWVVWNLNEANCDLVKAMRKQAEAGVALAQEVEALEARVERLEKVRQFRPSLASQVSLASAEARPRSAPEPKSGPQAGSTQP